MDRRLQFIADLKRLCFSMTELCARFRISRKTGYKWRRRYESEGPTGLVEHSRRPHSCPHETDSDLVRQLLEARRRHPTWGAKKLLALLTRRFPNRAWPARSSLCDLLKRHGLVPEPRRRRRPGHPGRPTTPMTAPNEIWTADFKGQFRTRDGVYCFPLTIVDGYSRFLLACQGLRSTAHEPARQVFQRLFQHDGLPLRAAHHPDR